MDDIELRQTPSGWLAIHPHAYPRVAAAGRTQEEAIAALEEEIAAWFRLHAMPDPESSQGTVGLAEATA